MSSLNVYVLNRANLTIKSLNQCFKYEINRDYLNNEKSRFSVKGSYDAAKGDFILVKEKSSSMIGNQKPFYFGIIDSFENNSIIACDLYNVANFEFPATRKTGGAAGGGFGQHIHNLLTRYLRTDESKLAAKINWTVDDSSKIAYSYQPKGPPTPTNLVNYLINGFKKYNITWEFDSIIYDNQNYLRFNTIIKRKTKIMRFKNNNYSLVNFDIYTNEVGRNLENKLLIIDKTMTNSEQPVILATYYLNKDGDVTQLLNDNVAKPQKIKFTCTTTLWPTSRLMTKLRNLN